MKLKITKSLMAYAIKHLGVKAGASEESVKSVIKSAISSGKITLKKLTELAKVEPKSAPAPAKKPVKSSGSLTVAEITRIAKEAAAAAVPDRSDESGYVGNPMKAFVGNEAVKVRVKSAVESYDASRTKAFFPSTVRKDGTGMAHPKAGQPATFGAEHLQSPSQLDKAVIGAYVKWVINSQTNELPSNLKMTDHDRDLIGYALHNMTWSGTIKSKGEMDVKRAKLTEFQQKALLDDTLSGGIEITPSVFDDAIILYPLLHGELFPYVNLKPTNARRVKSGSMQNPVITSGTSEGAPIVPIDTSSFFKGFDTPIFPASGAMQIGLDFEEDSPVDFGALLIQQFQEVALAKFDYWVAQGSGYNEPLGLLNTPGVTVLSSDNGLAGPATVSDYEALMFGVAKQYRAQANAVLAYISNDTTYVRSRGIKVGVTDQRRVFGMDHQNYMTLGRPHKIMNGIANSQAAFANLFRYRMYQRAGTTVRVETAGRTLALANSKLLVVRMRFGGQMEDAAAMSMINDLQG